MLRKRKSRVWLWINLFAVLPLFIAGAIYLVWYSGVFNITAVNLEGDAEPLSSNPIGKNILFWTASSEAPDIKFSRLVVRKDYIRRELTVFAEERSKEIIWCFGSINVCYWVDKDGILFSEAPEVSGALIKSVKDFRGDTPPRLGENVLDNIQYARVIQIFDILETLNLSVAEARIRDLNLRELEVDLSDGTLIIFSTNVATTFVETALRKLMGDMADWARIKSINLTVPGRAYPSY
ncbi:MAG: hypothetical protein HYS87_03595 [Candidatus Colwellbacteria bacterium]|nr:hypothetical protein [Candidatus Colwellbacteria bacterium]